MRQVGYLQ